MSHSLNYVLRLVRQASAIIKLLLENNTMFETELTYVRNEKDTMFEANNQTQSGRWSGAFSQQMIILQLKLARNATI